MEKGVQIVCQTHLDIRSIYGKLRSSSDKAVFRSKVSFPKPMRHLVDKMKRASTYC